MDGLRPDKMIGDAMDISLIIVVSTIICTGLLLFFAYMDLNLSKTKFKELEFENSRLKSRVIHLNMKISILESTNEVLSENANRKDNTFLINAEIKQAVKYARDKSHPDNGGKKEDFVLYQKLYEKICK